MRNLIKSHGSKARKEYRDDSADFIIEAMDWIRHEGALTFPERRAIIRLRDNKWMIKPGDIYVTQWVESEGTTYTFRSLPLILRICIKYNLYGE